LLLLFFLSAAASVPVWAWIAHVRGTKWTLLVGMIMAAVTFSFAVTLGHGDVWGFAVICLFSGAALGADMTLLPAMFSARVPVLDHAGFSTQETNSPHVLMVLTVTYAVVPTVLKLIALAVLYWTPIEETQYV